MSSPARAPLPLRVLKVAGVGVVIVLALVAILTALRTDPPRSPGVMSDAVGPEHDEPVDDYAARVSDTLATADGDRDTARWALVSLTDPWSVAEAADVVRDLPRVSRMFVQVPVDGVAMPVTGATLPEPIAGDSGRGEVFDRGLRQVSAVLGAGTAPTDRAGENVAGEGRAAAVASLTVSRIRASDPAIIGLLARGTSEQLRVVAEHPRVRAVEALPPDAVWGRFAIRPLLPQQTEVASPLPDTAPVPAG
ncbi:hypothetical protein [Dietzia alimentaria]|uniref:hypothetical protein n=1 Tax=Dietzia alimentaria TaxID=665550 RepID=UPI00029A6F46|nr:hypothetical protein [Dietzia alimentaria]